MTPRRHLVPAIPLLPVLALSLAACGGPLEADTGPQAPAAVASRPATVSNAAPVPAAATAGDTRPAAALPLVEVYKSPACGCCGSWVAHLRQSGFPVEVHEVEDLEPVRKQFGVPYGKGSCHTARVDGYVVEGHVPADDIRRLLAERPNARGLVLPGMPAGSPGMETPDGFVQRYTVELATHDGSTSPWATHGPL